MNTDPPLKVFRAFREMVNLISCQNKFGLSRVKGIIGGHNNYVIVSEIETSKGLATPSQSVRIPTDSGLIQSSDPRWSVQILRGVMSPRAQIFLKHDLWLEYFLHFIRLL